MGCDSKGAQNVLLKTPLNEVVRELPSEVKIAVARFVTENELDDIIQLFEAAANYIYRAAKLEGTYIGIHRITARETIYTVCMYTHMLNTFIHVIPSTVACVFMLLYLMDGGLVLAYCVLFCVRKTLYPY